MPIDNLGSKHISPAQLAQLDTFIHGAIDIMSTITQNLTEEERKEFGRINEYYKLLTNGVHDLATSQPELCSPDVNWVEFAADYNDRAAVASLMAKVDRLRRLMSDFKIVHDYDNYKDSITDYKYARYKSGTDTTGFTEKFKKLRQFFPNTGKKRKNSPATPATAPVV